MKFILIAYLTTQNGDSIITVKFNNESACLNAAVVFEETMKLEFPNRWFTYMPVCVPVGQNISGF